ncbi:MAG: DUF4827 domain-containing protein [Bacteroides sp.]|nr:DUF4827 domain-containing protein [Bacteroides sp.]MBQ8224679.1 DUF4827 domain-containing protein [Bacteroides sp.]
MKKLFYFLIALVGLSAAFNACDDNKTYAEMLEEEEDAIQSYIKDNNIKVISQSAFHANDSMTDVAENEYVHLANGVYMQIVDKGSENPADTVKHNDLVLVRFLEYDILERDSTLTNFYEPGVVDEFKYVISSSSVSGIFLYGVMLEYYGSDVPAGWLAPLSYVRNNAHVKLIVPSKMGHSTAMSYVTPYFYDIQKYQIWN